ncbi:MAG: helix-turn-helix transcriptional regulator [Pseudomonadota bacterium]
MILRQQISAARGLLGWSKSDLAARAGMSERTVARFESGEGDITVGRLERLELCLVSEGVEFVDGGVVLDRLRRAHRVARGI